ncbi:MAG: UDP-N-acetylmuramate dehydrogenase [Planctomycetota bacterium]|nr:MAG: UDP-N-acetylmuramate dehydrogenase [Planctomycetota bacterium]
MDFLSDLTQIVSYNQRLSPYTGFNLGGPVPWFVRPRTVDQLKEVIRRTRQENIPLRVLGYGANVLVGDEGVDGVVVRLGAADFLTVDWEPADGVNPGRPKGANGDTTAVVASAGVDMNRLAREAVRRGLEGLECMGGIPGTVGGIIRMNAGGRFGEIADVVRDITVIDEFGALHKLSRDEVGFGYRGTNLNGSVICWATLELKGGDPDKIQERFLAVWDHKKKTQPMGECSAGCVFKNTPEQSAGELIDLAGFKGRGIGGAYVSNQHANFIIAKEGATAHDVLTLIGWIRREVAERFGVELELEIELWGCRSTYNIEWLTSY